MNDQATVPPKNRELITQALWDVQRVIGDASTSVVILDQLESVTRALTRILSRPIDTSEYETWAPNDDTPKDAS
jgi:hypothetical protein